VQLTGDAVQAPSESHRAQHPALAFLILAGCNGEKMPSSAPPSATVSVRPGTDASAVLKRKMECRALAVQAEKEEFPEGMNTVKSLNQGLTYFESEFGYNEHLNTCITLTGFQLTDFETRSVTSYEATLTDLLTNKVLDSYLLLGGRLAPASTSTSREAFIARVRELLGEPVPRWLSQEPVR
jgi:hypothetical protein